MRFTRPLRRLLIWVVAATGMGCGDGTGPGRTPAPNFVRLESETGDYIGGGGTYSYTQADAVIDVTASEGLLSIHVDGDEWWFGDFEVPSQLGRLERGTYTGLERWPFHDPAKGGFTWGGEGRGCNSLTGSFTVDDVTYDGDELAAIDLRFEQHCEGMTPALRGKIRWSD